jgi:hypothetical protein
MRNGGGVVNSGASVEQRNAAYRMNMLHVPQAACTDRAGPPHDPTVRALREVCGTHERLSPGVMTTFGRLHTQVWDPMA